MEKSLGKLIIFLEHFQNFTENLSIFGGLRSETRYRLGSPLVSGHYFF